MKRLDGVVRGAGAPLVSMAEKYFLIRTNQDETRMKLTQMLLLELLLLLLPQSLLPQGQW